MEDRSRAREPIVNGIFYPDDEGELRLEVERLLSSSDTEPGSAGVIVSPHAGYVYAGEHMARAFRASEERNIETAVVIAPVHREPSDAIILTDSTSFLTPLGSIPVDVGLVHELETCSTRIYRNDIPHLEEHAIEVQLPLLQYLFPDVSLVPILVGRTSLTNTELLRKAILAIFQDRLKKTLFVVSSNLAAHSGEEEASSAAHRLLELVEAGAWEQLVSAYNRKEITACGAGCIAALMGPGLPKWKVRIMSKTDSASTPNDYEHFVHYGAIAFE